MPHDRKARPFVGQTMPSRLASADGFLCCPNCSRPNIVAVSQVGTDDQPATGFSCECCGFVGELQFRSAKGTCEIRWVRTFVSIEAEVFAGLAESP